MSQHGKKNLIFLIVTNFRKFSIEKNYCMDFVNLRQLTKVSKLEHRSKKLFYVPVFKETISGVRLLRWSHCCNVKPREVNVYSRARVIWAFDWSSTSEEQCMSTFGDEICLRYLSSNLLSAERQNLIIITFITQ